MNGYARLEQSAKYTMNKKNVDTILACSIYNFINGDSNKVPTFETLFNAIKNTDIGDKVSEGYGVTIKLEKVKDADDYEVAIEIEKTITGTKSRIDKITASDRITYLCIGSNVTNVKNLTSDDRRLRNFPDVDEKRYNILKTYLKEFGIIEINKKAKEKIK